MNEKVKTGPESGITLVAPRHSVGIRRYAQHLARHLIRLGVDATVADSDPRDGRPVHFHLSNSTRELYREIRRATSPSVVTLHDVIARTPLLRPLLTRYANRLLAHHHVVVHSKFAAGMLRSVGFRGEISVVRYAMCPAPADPARVGEIRSELAPDGRPILLSAGLLRETKNIPAIIDAAAHHPQWLFVFAGKVLDRATRDALSNASGNIRTLHTENGVPTDEEYAAIIAASTALLNLRTDSVGESSGPVVEAHALGVPVIGYECGALPEYCTDSDRLYPPGLSIRDVFGRLAQEPALVPEPASLADPLACDRFARQMIALYRRAGALS